MRPQDAQPTTGSDASTSTPTSSSSQPFLSSVRTLFAPRPHTQILADLAPQLLQTRILGRSNFNTRDSSNSIGSTSSSLRGRLGWTSTPKDSTSIYILERVDELLQMDVPPAPFELSPPAGAARNSRNSIEFPAPDAQVPLIRGFAATTPAAQMARLERRRKRAGLGEQALGLEGKLGLKARGDKARGLLAADGEDDVTELGINRRTSGAQGKKRRTHRKSDSGGVVPDEIELSPEELVKDGQAVEQDMSNVSVKRALLNGQISEVDNKMAALDAIREGLRRSLLALREEELELVDELSGIQELMAIHEERKKGRNVSASSRRRKGPAFLPTEHEDLPTGVAFMTLVGHLAPITSLDFTEPYGVAVTASLDESVRFWDLTTGDELGFLRGHSGVVKALQVESSVCVTGGADGRIKIWDLDLAEADRAVPPSGVDGVTNSMDGLNIGGSDVFGGGAGLVNGNDEGMMREEGGRPSTEEAGPCVRTLDGHTKAVTSLYFDDSCLVTGSSDRTLRQWDLQTGQCVLTMDILWAISNPQASQTLSSEPEEAYSDPYSSYGTPTSSPRKSLGGGLRRQSSGFGSPATTTYADGSWEMYEDFVGGVQFWGYALASGTGDGCVRMWDMRTGQAHRTLVGHTAPVTCVQFDELHLVSGSLDKSIRIWDLRTGAISDTIRYDHPITGLQFDSRKIVAAAGENGVRPSDRFDKAVALFQEAHATDPTIDANSIPESVTYHASLVDYVHKLSAIVKPGGEPSEALLLAANSQHIRRWERPRKDFPEGLSAYKMWRTGLNRFHATCAEETMLQAGYEADEDAVLIGRVKDLLLKKNLARPPLPTPLKDPEMQLFEDAICLVFLKLQFVDFAVKLSDSDKMVVILKKTWAKMTEAGRGVVAQELVGGLPEDLKEVVGKALA